MNFQRFNIVALILCSNLIIGMEQSTKVKETPQMRDMFVRSSEGKSLKLYGNSIEYIGWILDRYREDSTIGLPTNKLSIPVKIANLTLAKKLLDSVVRNELDELEYVHLDDMTLEELSDVITTSTFLKIKVLYKFAQKVFVEQLKGNIEEFVHQDDWIRRFEFDDQVLKDIESLILSLPGS